MAKKAISDDDELILFKKYSKTHDIEIRNEIVNNNLNLVHYIAYGCNVDFVEYEDLVSEGYIGLIKAVEKFNYKLGYKFSTYATYWIKNYIHNYIQEHSGPVRLPCYVHERLAKIRKHVKRYQYDSFSNSQVADIAEELGVPESDVELCIETLSKNLSLQLFISDDVELGDAFFSETYTIEEQCENADRDKAVLRAVNTFLSGRERYVISKLFGLFGSDVATLSEIGAELGVTKQDAHYFKNKALGKLRRGLEDWGYSNGRAA